MWSVGTYMSFTDSWCVKMEINIDTPHTLGSAVWPLQLGAVDLQEFLLQEYYIVLFRCFSYD